MSIKLKKILVLSLILSLLSAPMGSVFAAESSLTVPLRPLIQSMGGTIDWIASEQSIVFELSTGTYSYDSNSNEITRDGVKWPSPFSLNIKNGVSYVDKAFITALLGVNGEMASEGFVPISFNTLESNDLPLALTALRNQMKAYLTFEQWYQEFDAQVLVALGDTVLLHQAYGKANLITGLNASPEDTYSIGSVTKQMTAYAIMMLEEEGLLSFEDTIDQHLANAPYGDVVTIHHLLTHTSGLPEFTDVLFQGKAFSNDESILEHMSTEALNFEPGTEFLYCNSGYFLLGKIVEALTDLSLEDFLETRVFSALGMKQTGWAYKDGALQMTALGSIENEVAQALELDALLLSVAEGAGAVMSTTGDLYTWQKALYGGMLLDESRLALMAGVLDEETVHPNFGYGLIHLETPFGLEIGHGGNTIGYTASATYLPAMDLHIIILSNRGYVNLNGIKSNLYTLLAGGEVSLEPVESVDLSLEALERLEGDFEIPGILNIRMFVHEGKLMLQGEGQPPVAMTPLSETHFENRTFGVVIIYDDAVAPTLFTLYQNGQELEAQKK